MQSEESKLRVLYEKQQGQVKLFLVADAGQTSWVPAPSGRHAASSPGKALLDAIADWEDRRTNVTANFHVHGARVHPNDSASRQCAACHGLASPALSTPAAQVGGAKRPRDEAEEPLGELLQLHSAHVALLRSFEPDVVSKVHLGIFVPLHKFLAFDPAADRKKKVSFSLNPLTNELEAAPAQQGALLGSLVDWSEAFWRLAELSAVFRPASSGSFFKFYQWVCRRLRMGTSVLAIAAYTDAFRQAHAGSSRLLCETDVDILTSCSGSFFAPVVGSSSSSASPPLASPRAAPVATSRAAPPQGAVAVSQALRERCVSAKV
jgi:hypothetical protein